MITTTFWHVIGWGMIGASCLVWILALYLAFKSNIKKVTVHSMWILLPVLGLALVLGVE